MMAAAQNDRAAWSTSNLFIDPRETLETDPSNPAAKPFAGMRTTLTFSSRSAEMPEHLRAFGARDFAELKSLEANREKACVLLDRAAIKEAEELAAFEATFNKLASKHRTIFDASTMHSGAAEFSA